MSTAASIATAGMMENAHCIATSGFLCPAAREPLRIGLPAPARKPKDRRDLTDLRDLLSLMLRLLETR